MTGELKARLCKAVQEAISRQRGAFTGLEVAAALKRRDADLWDEAREVLATEKLVAIANGIMRGPLHQANSAQLAIEGFEDIPKYIRAGRKWLEIVDANADQLTEFIGFWRGRVEKSLARSKRDKRILEDVTRRAGVVRRYDAKTPGISLGAVLDIRAARSELLAFKHLAIEESEAEPFMVVKRGL